jgi:Ala-tRNA(Pro) deacylase
MTGEVFERLVSLLIGARAKFRVIEHEAEGRSDAICAIRGNRPEQGAKSIVLDVRGGGGGKRKVLAILPGNRKLDFAAVAALFDARKCGFAIPETAQALTGCVMGSVPPFALHRDLSIVADEDLLRNETLYFNAGRLDRSIELDTKDWIAVARPRVAKIAACCPMSGRDRMKPVAEPYGPNAFGVVSGSGWHRFFRWLFWAAS